MNSTPLKIDNRFKILREIGKSKRSEVFYAYDRLKDREVALKILKRGDISRDEDNFLRFRYESSILSSLSHPNIIRLYEVGVNFDNYWISTEMFEGTPLSFLIRKDRSIDTNGFVEIILKTAEVIRYLHSQGILHRDIKSSNILIKDKGGEVKIIDFCLSIFTAMRIDCEEEYRGISGTFSYISPE